MLSGPQRSSRPCSTERSLVPIENRTSASGYEYILITIMTELFQFHKMSELIREVCSFSSVAVTVDVPDTSA